MGKLNGGVGVMSRSEALKMLGISKEQDDEFQSQFLNGSRPKKPPTNRVVQQAMKEEKKYRDELEKRVEALEERVKMISNFLVI